MRAIGVLTACASSGLGGETRTYGSSISISGEYPCDDQMEFPLYLTCSSMKTVPDQQVAMRSVPLTLSSDVHALLDVLLGGRLSDHKVFRVHDAKPDCLT